MTGCLSITFLGRKAIFMLRRWPPDKEQVVIKSTKIQDKTVETSDTSNNEMVIFDFADMAKRLMNNPALMKTVAEVFCQDLHEQIKGLKVSIKDSDVAQAVNILHQIKGASANVGGKALAALALEMELAGKAGKLDYIQQNIDQLEHAFYTLKVAMQQALA